MKRHPVTSFHSHFEFKCADIRVRSQRHLMFATKQQREFLANAKSWYIEVTFKLCRHPFTQLVTVDAFVRKDDHAKLVLLLFVLMSEMSYASNNDTDGWHHGLNRRVSGRGKLLSTFSSSSFTEWLCLQLSRSAWYLRRN